MKKWKSLLSAVLAGIMILSSAYGIFAAPNFTDVSTHWAWKNGYIPYLVEKNVLNGYKLSDGTSVFKPDDNVTRAEFIKMLDETFGLVDTAKVTYNDVKTSDWFYPYFAKAIAQGYVLNYGSYATPNGKLTREEATTLLIRYLGLAEAEKAPSYTFSDYNSITDYYKNPVMAAVKAGLIEGYEDGTFRPKNTLSRAEALTILYRAAGAIYNTSASGRDLGAADTNAVITKGGVVLSNLTLKGRVIITEGVSGEAVVLDDTNIVDTLYVRGKTNVIINGTNIKNLVVESKASDILITLADSAKVENLTLNTTAKLSVSSGSKIVTLTVNAKSVSITGAGNIDTINVNANGLISSIMPKNYEIAEGLTANLDGKVFEGSSDFVPSFVFTPYLTEDDGYYYLNISPIESGQVFYYFTSEPYAPTVKDFDSLYLSANYKDTFSVTGNKIYCESTFLKTKIKQYDYLVIQLTNSDKDYTPIIIDNKATSGTGFYLEPELTDETTISFTPEYSGTVYYYYTDTMDNVSTAQFTANYAESDRELKGTISVSALRNEKITLKERYLENYPYIVLVLQNDNTAYFTPVVISVGDDGFIEKPSISTLGTITFKSKFDGTLYYYYAKSEKVPTSADYIGTWRNSTNKGQVTVSKDKAGYIKYEADVLSSYPYIIFSIKDSDGNYSKPYVLHIEAVSGFQVEPYVSGKSTISYKTTVNGTVYWYLSQNATAPTSASEFTKIYSATPTTRCGSEKAYASSLGSFTYPANYASTYPYLVIMLEGSNDSNYLPVVLDLKTTTDSGFEVEPYAQAETSKVRFRTKEPGTVYYYYVRVSSDSFDYTQNFGSMFDNTPQGYKGSISVGTDTKYLDYSSIDLDRYPGVVMCFVNDADEMYTPVYVPLVESGSMGGVYGITVENIGTTSLKIGIDYTGTLYYMGQDISTAPTDSTLRSFGSSREVTAGSYEYIPITEGNAYIALKLNDCTTLVVHVRKQTDNGDADDGATARGNGFDSYKLSFDDNNKPVFTFTPLYDGIVYISTSISGTSNVSVSVVANQTYSKTLEFSINDLINSGLGNLGLLNNFKYYLQLTSGTTVYERIVIPVIN